MLQNGLLLLLRDQLLWPVVPAEMAPTCERSNTLIDLLLLLPLNSIHIDCGAGHVDPLSFEFDYGLLLLLSSVNMADLLNALVQVPRAVDNLESNWVRG